MISKLLVQIADWEIKNILPVNISENLYTGEGIICKGRLGKIVYNSIAVTDVESLAR